MTKIGITGHSSFLGRHLVPTLRKAGKEVLLFEGDIRNPVEVAAFVEASSTIYHLAGFNRGTDKDVYEINMIGGANVTAAAAVIGDRHIIFPSSNYLLRFPNSPYSICKKAVENMLRKLAGTNNCRASIFKLSNTYGPLALPFHVSVVATFCWFEANGRGDQMPIDGDGSQKVELTPVDVVISRFLELAEYRDPLSFIEISGREFSILELAETVRDLERRKMYPAIVEMVKFFNKPHNMRVFPKNVIAKASEDTLMAKLSSGRVDLMKDYRVVNLQPGYQRQGYQSVADNCWIFLSTGAAAVDVFLPDEEYINTLLIDGHRIKGIEITANYKYKIRNLSPDSINLGYYYEKDNIFND